MNNTTTVPDYGPVKSQSYQNLNNYAHAYWEIHPYLSLIICVFGISTNLVNVFILCQDKMRNSINCILTGIAVSDIMTMLDYIPFAVQFYLLTGLGKNKEVVVSTVYKIIYVYDHKMRFVFKFY